MSFSKNLKEQIGGMISKTWNRQDVFIAVFIVSFLMRVVVAVWSGNHGSDIDYHLYASKGLLEGGLLYIDLRFDYPPLHAYFQAFFLKLLGDNILAAKMPAILGDLAFAWILYVVGKELNICYGRKLALCYLSFPLSLLSSDWYGLFDSVALFLMVTGIYSSLKGQDMLAATSIGIGTMYKWFPSLAFIPILFHSLAKRKVKKILLYGIVISGICLVVSAPFLLLDAQKTLDNYLFNSRKYPDSFSIFRIFPIASKTWPFVVQIIVVFVLFFLTSKYGIFEDFSFESITLFVALFIMFNKNLYPHYFLWFFPFLAYWYICNNQLPKLAFILLIDTPLLVLFWVRNGELVNSSVVLPVIFHVLNWTAIGYAIFKQNLDSKNKA